MALLMSTTGSLAHRKIVPDIFLCATKHALLKIIHVFSRVYFLKIMHGSHGIAFKVPKPCTVSFSHPYHVFFFGAEIVDILCADKEIKVIRLKGKE